MPTQKDLKRLVRTRMQKTGESYTAARSRVLEKKLPTDLESRAGMSDAAVRAKTGKTWRQWTLALDALGAVFMPHKEIARRVFDGGDVSHWWAQSVTVGYERIRGLREIGQRRGGSYEANKSKTFAVPVAKLYRAFSTARTRATWLEGIEPKTRTSTVNRSVRWTWPDGTSVHAYFTNKGPKKSQVSIQHTGLARKPDIEQAKESWARRFALLADVIGPPAGK